MSDHSSKSAGRAGRRQSGALRTRGTRRGAARRHPCMRRWTSSPPAASRRRGSTTSPAAPASPRAPSTSISRTRRRCSRSWCAPCWCRTSPRSRRCRRRGRCGRGSRRSSTISCARCCRPACADVIRLVIAEGPRFPALAEFYYREVVSRALAALSRLLQRGVATGEIRIEALVRFPQLVVAPVLMGVIWGGMFNRFAPLDIGGADAGPPRHAVRAGEGAMMRAVAIRASSSRWRAARRLRRQRQRLPGLDRGRSDLRRAGRGRAGRDAVGRRGRHRGARRRSLHRRHRPAEVGPRLGRRASRSMPSAPSSAPRSCSRPGRHAEDFRRGAGAAARRRGAARRRAHPAGAPQGGKPGRRHGGAGLFPPRRGGGRRPPGGGAAAAGQSSRSASSCRKASCRASRSATR